MKLAIISHTQHYVDANNAIVGWGPTIKEINYLLDTVDTVYHIAPLHNEKPPSSSLPYASKKIIYIPLKPSGGSGWKKLSILFTAPYNIFKIVSTLHKVDKIQFRAPTGMGIYVLPLLKLYPSNKYWVKYAGNWKDKFMPLGNKLQKKWLQKCTATTTKITVNGTWAGERENIIPFENPCLDDIDRKKGEKIIESKELRSKLVFCFVGALNEHKGVSKIIDAFSKLSASQKYKVEVVHFVGDGKERQEYISRSEKSGVQMKFHGFLSKDQIITTYQKSNFIILPSKSEGFPKVIGEAMNYGCLPIVSNVSCLEQYIENNKNGFLIKPNTIEELVKAIEKALESQSEIYQEMLMKNYLLAEKFTYKYYNNRILSEILNQ
ncbi:glycosyltransferase [Flavicella marina]|uniref:glycosyltransferase n=1 Tax=Flavicella marina TaxID=1475951 RepID=UPI0012656814|nr:glycosyltransferase [Flavicella marina]